MINVTLNNGVEMPILGFGVFQVPDEKECEAAVSTALEVGYRSIDTASLYLNEKAVGRAIASSGIPREELFITTKAWVSEAGEEASRRAFERSRERLGLDYIDLYLVHQPFGDYYGTWRTLERLYTEKQVRAIGVSNFYPDRLMDLMLHNEIVPAVNQIETHPFFQRVDFQTFMKEHKVHIESWAPFAEGRNDLFNNPLLTKIAHQHGKTVAQVVLRWLIQREVIVIPKSVHTGRIQENFDVFSFELSPAQMHDIATMDTDKSLFFDHSAAFTAERLSGIVLSEEV